MLSRKVLTSVLIALLIISATANYTYAQRPEELFRELTAPIRTAAHFLGGLVVIVSVVTIIFKLFQGWFEAHAPVLTRARAFGHFVGAGMILAWFVAGVLMLGVASAITTDGNVGPQANYMIDKTAAITLDFLFSGFSDAFNALMGGRGATSDFVIEYTLMTNTTLNVAVRNAGSQSINSVTLTAPALTLTPSSFTEKIEKGEAKLLSSAVGGAEAGKTYTIIVTATFESNVKVAHTVDVPCVS